MSDPTTPSNANPAGGAPESGRPEDARTCRGRRYRRRGWFLVGAAVLTGLVGFGLGRATGARWHSHGAGFGMNQPLDSEAMMRRADAGLSRMVSAVDGTADQKARIGEISRAAIKDLQPMREAFRGSRDKLAAALKAEPVDRAAIETLRAEQLALGETASKRASQALTDAAEVLTPAQRAKLVERWQKRSWRG